MLEFGPEGWEPCDYSPIHIQKLVDGVLVSAERVQPTP